MAIDLSELLASPGFAPKAWQSPAPEVWTSREAVGMSSDLQRVLGIPRRPVLDPTSERAQAMIELITSRHSLGDRPCKCAAVLRGRGMRARPCIRRPFPVQAWALYEMGLGGGALGMIAVGAGKTFLDIMAAMVVPDCRTAVLLVPPNLVEQLVNDYYLIAQHWRVPQIVSHGRDKHVGPKIAGVPILHVLPYSVLSLPKSSAILAQISPDLIIADECQSLRHVDGAGASRFMRYLDSAPGVRFCGWTGSLSESKIADYAHLSKAALGIMSPLPHDPEEVAQWGRAIDPSKDEFGEPAAPPGALMQLMQPDERGQHIRSIFRRRLVETRGVIATTDASVTTQLILGARKAPPIPPVVADALTTLRAAWVRPDGEELVDAFAVARCARELACGFYYRWKFPRGEPETLIVEWLRRRAQWNCELRQKLLTRAEHLDSPLLCARAAARAWGQPLDEREDGDEERDDAPEDASHLPVWPAETWCAWRDIRDQVQPESEAVWLDDYLVHDTAEWGHENRGIIWYDKAAFGKRVSEVSGLDLHGGGPGAGARIEAVTGERSIVVSIDSHGTGRNGLQLVYDAMHFANPPSSTTRWEQALGRLLRPGQRSAAVRAYYYRHTPELRANVKTAIGRAIYVRSTLGAQQHLADHDEGEE